MAIADDPERCPTCGQVVPPLHFHLYARDRASKMFDAIKDYIRRNGSMP